MYNSKVMGVYETMDAVDDKIKELCEELPNYKSHNSIYPSGTQTDTQASFLIHTKIVLTDDSIETVTHSLVIDKPTRT